MAYRFLLAIHNDDGTIPMEGTNNRIPLVNITTLQGAINRVKIFKLNRGKPYTIFDMQGRENYTNFPCKDM